MSLSIYKSSAGSGKTYTLTFNYLKLLLQQNNPDYFKHILAVTFTNKAANEMKSRILSSLKEFSDYEERNQVPNSLLQDLSNALHISFNDIAVKSKNIRNHILHNYSSFYVGTIDQFVNSVLKNFETELNLPLNFNVELDQTSILEKVIDHIVNQCKQGDPTTDSLLEFIQSRIDEDKSWHIKSTLKTFLNIIFNEESSDKLSEISKLSRDDFKKINTELNKYCKIFKKDVIGFGKRFYELLELNKIQPQHFKRGALQGVPNHFKKLKNFVANDLRITDSRKSQIEEGDLYSKNTDEEIAGKLDNIADDLRQLTHQAEKYLDDNLSKYELYSSLSKNIYALSLLSYVYKALEKETRSNSLVLISDFNKRLSEIVKNEPAPFIYEKYGNKFFHFLMDEFQDTSELQWQNLLPLIENSLSHGNDNLIVGDGKQSIYRFRGAKSEQFVNLPYNYSNNNLTIERLNTFIQHHKIITPKKNYRSREEIIAFNNFLFSKLSDSMEGIKSVYKEVIQKPNNQKGGYIKYQLLEKDNLVESTLLELKKLKAINYPLEKVTLLARKNSVAIKYAEELLKNGFSIETDESLILANSIYIKLILSFLKLIIDPTNINLKADILAYAFQLGFVEDMQAELEFIKTEKEDGFISNHFIHFNQNHILTDSYNTLCLALNTLNIDSRNPFIEKLKELAFINQEKYPVLSDFIEYLDSIITKKSIESENAPGSIRIMTIHKAKGLEFETTFLLECDWKYNRSELLWVPLNEELNPLHYGLVNSKVNVENITIQSTSKKEEELKTLDEINTLYVAFTRAKSNLFVFADKKTAKGKVNLILNPVIQSHQNWKNENFLEIGEFQKFQKSENIHHLDSIEIKKSDLKESIWVKSVEFVQDNNLISELSDRQSFGQMLHDTLANIFSSKDIENALAKSFQKFSLDENAFKNLKNKIEFIVNESEISKYFQKFEKVITEKNIAFNNEILRPDRINFNKNEIIIIDYKTGTPREEDIWQVTNYINCVMHLYTKKTKGIIYYSELNKLETIESTNQLNLL